VATHLSRMVPPLKARAMYFTGSTATAQDLEHYGSVWKVVPREQLRDAALEVAAVIAAKDTRVMRFAKEAMNGIDLWDVNKSYRYEQGYTFEINLLGVADEHRDRFVEKGANG
jgi:enoyl-CoA hydratase